jgi:hypothetical protein
LAEGCLMSLLDDPDYWRARAEEIRRMVNTERDPGTKALLEVLAQSYDDLAVRAAARLRSNSEKNAP